jgi:hypothetical protein
MQFAAEVDAFYLSSVVRVDPAANHDAVSER